MAIIWGETDARLHRSQNVNTSNHVLITTRECARKLTVSDNGCSANGEDGQFTVGESAAASLGISRVFARIIAFLSVLVKPSCPRRILSRRAAFRVTHV